MIGFVLAAVSLWFMRPYARLLLPSMQPPLLLLATTVALSIGTASQIVLWLGLLSIPIDWWLVLMPLIGLIIMGIGWRLVWQRRDSFKLFRLDLRLLPLPAQLSVVLCIVLAVLILFNAVYWPFAIDDAVAIYAFWGKQIALTGALPTGVLYETYPQLVQTLYAIIFQASGQINEYAAALIPAALSVGVMLAAYLLGSQLFSWTAGLIAALIVALTPAYANWASASYVDLPMGFFYAMTAVFLVRWEREQRWQDAMLTGVMAGLAMWTKNNGLLLIPILGLWSVYQIWRERRLPNLRLVTVFALALMAVGAPWYIRNVLMAGVIVPPTGWTDKAIHTVTTLVPYLTDRPHFPTGVVLTAGLLFTLWQVVHSRGRDQKSALLVIFYVPFFTAWWWLVSYDVRFLFGVLPIVAVIGARAIEVLVRWLWQRQWFVTFYQQRGGRALIMISMVALAALPLFTAVDYKTELIRQPFPSDEEKHRIAYGARYEMAQWINGKVPSGSVLRTQDLLLPFLVDAKVISGGWPTDTQQLEGYDYWVLSPSDMLPAWFGDAFGTQPLYETDGYRLYPLTPKSTLQ
jgi:hypothetical protein